MFLKLRYLNRNRVSRKRFTATMWTPPKVFYENQNIGDLMTNINYNFNSNIYDSHALLYKELSDFKNVYIKYISRVESVSFTTIHNIFQSLIQKERNAINAMFSLRIEPSKVLSYEALTESECFIAIYGQLVLYIEDLYNTKRSKVHIVSSEETPWLLQFIEKFKKELAKFCLEEHEEVTWFYVSGGRLSSINFPIKKPKEFHPESYPFITEESRGNKTVDEWIEGFVNSPSNILILNGPVGTGKSTLLTRIISNGKFNTMTAFDEKVMKNDDLYVSFLAGTHDLLIMEDADLYLLDRVKKDNETMSKLLNISEGIIDTSHKKIIFTANLENLDVIDKAVRRPGRCYDIVEFRELTFPEANVMREKLGKKPFKKDREYSLAEIYNK